MSLEDSTSWRRYSAGLVQQSNNNNKATCAMSRGMLGDVSFQCKCGIMVDQADILNCNLVRIDLCDVTGDDWQPDFSATLEQERATVCACGRAVDRAAGTCEARA